MTGTLRSLIIILGLVLTACSNHYNSHTQSQQMDTKPMTKDMNSFLSIFEIPTTDMPRAVAFYQSLLDIKIETIDMQGMQMGVFPSEGRAVSGVLVHGEGYTPSADGVVIYLNGGEDLQGMLDKVEPNGGTVIVPKTLIDEENGYFAMFLDTEGNRLGVHSPK